MSLIIIIIPQRKSAAAISNHSMRSIPTYVIRVPERHGRTDRQTHRQRDYILWHNRITALCVASRGKNEGLRTVPLIRC